ncbi:hypothetical protein GT348_03625 [Aristophania vespae]|uniref:Uncharacterized protein n=1 Tax=Aristophania vespae TaxID=2697033 RepID=A0A6P1NA30_9PROT|nr:hypothetical protein [Aristophania vespae]QHI95475.1 hypothetical protein GT348_03625 [Aristophania vespae]UMM64778.1 hypothetical protein DM15PD_17980 [Aristophania vespae]
MSNLSLMEASAVIALLLDSMTKRKNLDLGSEAIMGLAVILKALKKTLDQAATEIDRQKK